MTRANVERNHFFDCVRQIVKVNKLLDMTSYDFSVPLSGGGLKQIERITTAPKAID